MSSERTEHGTMSAGHLSALMDNYGEAVWNYAYMLSGSGAVADDIAQETFIRAYKHMSRYRGEAAVKTWLLRIARNRWYSYRNAAFIRRVTLQDRPLPEKESASAEEEALRQSVQNEVWGLVLSLPRKYKEILILSAHYGLTMEEIAGTLGISVSAAKSRLLRARRTANERWEEERERYGQA